MQLYEIMNRSGKLFEVLDFLKVPIPSAATIVAWFSDFNVIDAAQVVQEIGILIIIILNAWWVWHKIKGQLNKNRWAKEDRQEEVLD